MINFIQKTFIWFGILMLLIIGLAVFAWMKWLSGPSDIIVTEPRLQAAVVELNADKNLVTFVAELEDHGVIRSDKLALSLIQRLGIEKKIKRGAYVFKGGENIFGVLSRLSNADYGYVPARVTIPEGFTVARMAASYSAKLVDIKPEDFIKEADQYEGYLFPDTYFFYPYATSGPVISAMLNNFDRQVAIFQDDLAVLSGATSTMPATATTTPDVRTRTYGQARSAKDIIIMASILEKEVQTNEDKAMVADLFWRRIQEGMALQADSTLTYVTGKTSAQLTTKDLRDKSPYNSYTNRGLPPTPISNPGIESIRAALFPQKNQYVYFLSDNDGTTHFSRTYAEHLRLKEKYLR